MIILSSLVIATTKMTLTEIVNGGEGRLKCRHLENECDRKGNNTYK